jgi:hypothetical protein
MSGLYSMPIWERLRAAHPAQNETPVPWAQVYGDRAGDET